MRDLRVFGVRMEHPEVVLKWKKSENPQKLIRFEKSCSRRSLILAALEETGRN